MTPRPGLQKVVSARERQDPIALAFAKAHGRGPGFPVRVDDGDRSGFVASQGFSRQSKRKSRRAFGSVERAHLNSKYIAAMRSDPTSFGLEAYGAMKSADLHPNSRSLAPTLFSAVRLFGSRQNLSSWRHPGVSRDVRRKCLSTFGRRGG